MDDLMIMKRAIKQALKGTGKVSPNPRVGAIVVKNGRILAEGYHAFWGGPHAEIDVLSKLNSREAEGSTLYVNLEPCNHYGKTPPCTDVLIQSGIKKVVIGTSDPNPLVAGNGIQVLGKAGIEIKTGILEEECIRLNQAYFKFITQKTPYITLKAAQTLDGKIATQSGRSKWITNEASRKRVHQMRRESDAVLIGITTVLADDPELTVRGMCGVSPRRIVLDSHLRIPLTSKLIRSSDPEKTIVATLSGVSIGKIMAIRKTGAVVWILKSTQDGKVDLKSLLKKASQEKIASILVEGGKAIFTAFLKSKLVDKIVLFEAPKLFGKGVEAFGDLDVDDPSKAFKFRSVTWSRSGNDMVFEGTF